MGAMVLSCSSDDNNNNPPATCDEAVAATAAAQQAYDEATNENFVQKCNAYKDALEDEIAVCGDESGDLQDIIDGLDCTEPTTSNGAITMGVGSAPLAFDVITVTTTGTTRHVHGEKSTSTSYSIDFDVEVGQTGNNKILNFHLNLLNHDYVPMVGEVLGVEWTNNVSVNTASQINATFHGYVESDTTINQQEILNGVADIDF